MCREVGERRPSAYNPRSMRKTALLRAALVVIAAAAPALAYERVEIRNKDVVLGQITDDLATHEYLIDVPRDAVLSLSLPKQKKSRLQGSMGLFRLDYRGESLLLIGKRKIQQARLPTVFARYRAIVQGVNGSTGTYVLKPKIKVQKKYKIIGRRSDLSPPGQIVFGALPGYAVQVKITWKGPDPVTIASFTAPDGSDMTSAVAGRQKKSSFRQKGYRTTQVGDHRIVLDIPPSANQWALSVVQKGRSVGRLLALREAQVAPPELDLLVAGGPLPLIVVKDEVGAGNEVVLTANNTTPRVIAVLGGDPQESSLIALEGGSTPARYLFLADDTHSALITVGSRNAGRRILSLDVDPIVAPGGDGKSTFRDLVYDASNRLVGWTETRTFDASGNTHTLVISDILSAGGAYTYTVLHRRPDGTTRRYDALPFQ